MDTLFHSFHEKIALKTTLGIEFFIVSDIICFFIERRKVKVILIDGTTIKVFHSLTELESAMTEFNFYRCHASRIINLVHIKRYTHKTGILELSNNLTIKVACYRKTNFNNLINSQLPLAINKADKINIILE